MKLYSHVIVGNDVVKRLEERGELLPFLKKHLAGKIADALADRIMVYRKEDYGDNQSGMTRYECAVNIDCLSLYPMCGIGFGLLPLDYEEVDRIVKQMVQDEIGMDIDSVNL